MGTYLQFETFATHEVVELRQVFGSGFRPPDLQSASFRGTAYQVELEVHLTSCTRADAGHLHTVPIKVIAHANLGDRRLPIWFVFTPPNFLAPVSALSSQS